MKTQLTEGKEEGREAGSKEGKRERIPVNSIIRETQQDVSGKKYILADIGHLH